MLLCIFIETTLPYLQTVSEHGEVLPPSSDYENRSVLVPLVNGFPYGTTQSFEIFVSANTRELVDSLFRNGTSTFTLTIHKKWLSSEISFRHIHVVYECFPTR